MRDDQTIEGDFRVAGEIPYREPILGTEFRAKSREPMINWFGFVGLGFFIAFVFGYRWVFGAVWRFIGRLLGHE